MTKLYILTIETLIILGLCIMVGLTFSSAMIRFIPGFGGIFWAEEITRYVSIWVVFLAAGLGVRYGIHLSVDMVAMALPEALRRAFFIFSYLLMMVFQGVLVFYGTQLAISNYAQQSASLQMPMTYAYAAIPVGAAIMLFETARLVYLEATGTSTAMKSFAD
ncbi:MAG: TRAP transporter small permease [Paracoccaceae bacterium]|nr:MAG: TRAP transporter small permease [Paracoccaceae bacterium]